ncbi:MAG TPA: murein biosynthesis integral membrane protein MurJ [Pyrinomonadaceae bacterium]|nr:murein biosynthesis integral membrane protein MurJ [Pyrinomonadaceae bacterium]
MNDSPKAGNGSKISADLSAKIPQNQSPTLENDSDPNVSIGADSHAGRIAGETVETVGTGTFTPAPSSKLISTGRSAFLVGAGILASRIVGLIRQRVFAHYFGTSAAGDAFSAAFRIPNFLQNVFGEGALSASFIPVYAKLLAKDEDEASHVASAILAMLALVTSTIVVGGVLIAPYLVSITGFEGETRELTVRLIKIFFPGAGLLVLSAWCLGVLNSHHKFFLSYTAPVAWNLAIITALILFGGRVGQFQLAEFVAWGSVIGSALQFAVQLPTVLTVIHRLRPVVDLANAHVRTVMRNFIPVFTSRGVVQISAFVDTIIASFLPAGAVVALSYAQSLYTLPVSLFGMSVSAAELPAMSRTLGTVDEVAAALRQRLDAGLRRIAFFIVPSSMAFLVFGDVIAAVLYQTGEFRQDAVLYVWGILAGSTVGLLASTLGRLYSSTYYALHDTRTPLRYAIVHVVLATVLGYFAAIHLPPALGIDPKWGVTGLTVSAGIAGWIEFVLLRHTLNKRIGTTGLPPRLLAILWLGAAVGAIIGWGLKLMVGVVHPIPMALLVLGSYGVTYFGVTSALGINQARRITNRVYKTLKFWHS